MLYKKLSLLQFAAFSISMLISVLSYQNCTSSFQTNTNVNTSTSSQSADPAVPWCCANLDENHLEMGGPVHSFFDIGAYPENPTTENWNSGVKSIIARYHLDPQKVRNQLADIRAAGQTKIGFNIYFVESLTVEEWIHCVSPTQEGSLRPQHAQNLVNFLTDIQNAGFEQVQIRFGPQGGASVDINNTVFNQSIFDFHWNMVRSTHQLVSAMNFKMKIFFDPTPEFVGLPHVATNPAFNKYIKSMYQNYVTAFGANDIIQAFNGADLSGSIATLQIYKDVGVFPSIIAIDIYHDFDATFGRLAKVLTQFGIPKHPIFVQETFFNDERSAFEIIRAKKNYALNIRYVMNWPLSRAEDSKRRGSQVDIRSMNQYGSFASYVVGSGFSPGPIPDNFRLPDPSGITPTLISANSSGNVLRISASNLESDFRIDVRKVGNPGIDWVYFQFDDMTLLQNNFGTEITLTVNAIPILAAISNPGVEFWLVNPTSHTAVKAITVTGP